MSTTQDELVDLRRTTGRRRSNNSVKRGNIRGRERWAGLLFVGPGLAVLLIFLVVPIGLAFYVSLTRWHGLSSPFGNGAKFTGLQNYRSLLTEDSLTRQNLAVAVRNNFYFVLFVVPIQTMLALFLAVLLNNKFLKGKSYFRTAFYFPSVTSSIAITLVFLFLFQGSGAVNRDVRDHHPRHLDHERHVHADVPRGVAEHRRGRRGGRRDRRRHHVAAI